MEPRPLLELDVQQAISSILQKPHWWIKSRDPEIRKRWMDEVEQQLLLKTFGHSLVNWRHGQEPLDCLEELLQEPDSLEKHTKLRVWLKGIITGFGMDAESDEEYSDAESVEDEETEKKDTAGLTEEERKSRALKQEVESQQSYPTVKWTLNQLLLHEKLSVVPVEQWTEETIGDTIARARGIEDPELVPRAAQFVLAVRRGVSAEDALLIPPGSDLLGVDRLVKLQMHCEKIHCELNAVQLYMTKVIMQIAEREGLNTDTDPNKVVLRSAGVDGVWISDNAVPEDVAAKFKSEVAVLESVPDDEKDWHPHSNERVLDLVHPSLFCCVFGQTLKASRALEPSSFSMPAEQMNRLMFTGSEVVKRPTGCSTDYQWIPTDFVVAEGGEPRREGDVAVRTLSYINNLHPEQHTDLYDSIGEILARFVPLFEHMLSDRAAGMLPSTFNVDMISHDSWRELPRRPRVPDVVELPPEEVTISLRGKTLQIIVKIAEIVLTPENPDYEGGAWHIEGTPAERIVGTGIYYFACENIQDSRLAFRAEVEEPPYQQSDDDGVAEIYGLFNEELLVQVLGSVESSTYRCVVFPNWLQHQVQPFTLEDLSKPGVRKFLAFFLVDPEHPVPSTSVVPPQQQKWIEPALESMIQQLRLVDVVGQNIQSMMPRGMSLLAAKQHRLQLMEERAAAHEDGDDTFGNSRYFSLCEH
ncbi:hypothetical protein PHYPSEUDO_001468 [Phytophthora pseudosyringae]|uniref:DUF4246 domain-containing protein n=1 Tax=Phytophthora pseudosyringae TaxID=221518 RepID=A0A8T1V749_9STRA|nr:hypothetical protein PHYPSEUDO_001468 [Phytophthora pseudosyringae]